MAMVQEIIQLKISPEKKQSKIEFTNFRNKAIENEDYSIKQMHSQNKMLEN